MARLKGHRLEQLKLLAANGATTRENAIAVSVCKDRFAYRPGTLSAMVGEGLVANAYLAPGGDSRRRLSHYWLTEAGLKALEEFQR